MEWPYEIFYPPAHPAPNTDLKFTNIHSLLNFQLIDAPSAHQGTLGDKSKAKSKASDEDKEIEAMLAQLKG